MRSFITPGRRGSARAASIGFSELPRIRRWPMGSGSWQAQATANGGWNAPLAYGPDTLTNNEIGWKTTLLDQRLRWVGAVYQENWNQAQIGAFATDVLAGATINGGNYRVRGVETFIQARATAGLTFETGAAWNHSALVKEAAFYWANGSPINFSSLQTSTGQKLANPAGTIGSSLAGAPSFQGNFRARYEFDLGRLSSVRSGRRRASVGLDLDHRSAHARFAGQFHRLRPAALHHLRRSAWCGKGRMGRSSVWREFDRHARRALRELQPRIQGGHGESPPDNRIAHDLQLRWPLARRCCSLIIRANPTPSA